jgi:chorismate synthase
MLKEIGIEVFGAIAEIDGIKSLEFDFEYAKKSIVKSGDKNVEEAQIEAVTKAKKAHDSVGGAVLVKAVGVPVGLGEPLYHKLDSQLASALMGINAAKAVEIGDGISSCRLKGSQNNDAITKDGFASNHSGGVLGGISNGDEVVAKVWFKPTPSIFKEQTTLNTKGEEIKYKLQGRHDPCVAIRGVVVAEAMMALTLADMALLNMNSKIDYLKKVYQK